MRPGDRDQSHPRHLVMVTLVIVTTTRAGGGSWSCQRPAEGYHILVNLWISLPHFQLVSSESKNPKYLLTTMVSGSAGRKSESVGELTARIRRLTADVNTRAANSHISAIFTVARLMLCLDIRSWTRRAQCTIQLQLNVCIPRPSHEVTITIFPASVPSTDEIILL